MVVIDTDVFVLAFAFHRDSRQAANSQFLEVVRTQEPAITIYSVMELLGQLSFNLSAERLAQWRSWLQYNFGLAVIYPATANRPADEFFRVDLVEGPLQRMARRSFPLFGQSYFGTGRGIGGCACIRHLECTPLSGAHASACDDAGRVCRFPSGLRACSIITNPATQKITTEETEYTELLVDSFLCIPSLPWSA